MAERAPARGGDRHPRDARSATTSTVPTVEPIAGQHPRRGVRRGRGAEHGAGLGARPRGRAGGAAPQHRRQLRQPRPPQPEPARPPARLHHRARDQRDRPRHAVQPVPARPPGHPHAPQRRVAAGAGRHRAAPPVGGTGAAHRRHPGRPRRGRGLPAGHGPRRRTRHHHRLRRRRPRPPAGRAHRERPRVLAPRPDRRHPRARPSHVGADGGGYTLAIIDSGLGMPAGDVAAANRRLAGAECFTIAPSKYLGHYVAGNLAARHGIRVHLDNSPGNGITATIDLPVDLLTTRRRPGRADAGTAGSRAAIIDTGARSRRSPPLQPFEVAVRTRADRRRVVDADQPRRARPVSALATPAGRVPGRPRPRRPSRCRPAPPAAWSSGRGAATTAAPAATMPDGELLASLSNIASNLTRTDQAAHAMPPAPRRGPRTGGTARQPVDRRRPAPSVRVARVVAGPARPRTPEPARDAAAPGVRSPSRPRGDRGAPGVPGAPGRPAPAQPTASPDGAGGGADRRRPRPPRAGRAAALDAAAEPPPAPGTPIRPAGRLSSRRSSTTHTATRWGTGTPMATRTGGQRARPRHLLRPGARTLVNATAVRPRASTAS